MIALRSGTSRYVLLLGRLAIKVPRLWPLSRIARGLRGNWFERRVALRYAPVFGWHELCPVLFADRFGLVLVMPRAEPVTHEDIRQAADDDHYPAPPYEFKPEDWGRLPDGRVVAVDFADDAHPAESLRERCEYLDKKLLDR